MVGGSGSRTVTADEWKRSGVSADSDYARLTDMMSKVWSGMTTREYKQHKGLTDQNLRDNMTNMELLLNALAEQTATDLSKARNPKGLTESAYVAKDGAEVARNARADIEQRLGHSVISSEKTIDHIQPMEELPFKDAENKKYFFCEKTCVCQKKAVPLSADLENNKL